MVFALPGELGLTELVGDFKIHFHDRQGDFYWLAIYLFVYALGELELISFCFNNCYFYFSWLNTTMTENRKTLTTNDLDGFDKVNIFCLLCNVVLRYIILTCKMQNYGKLIFAGMLLYSSQDCLYICIAICLRTCLK